MYKRIKYNQKHLSETKTISFRVSSSLYDDITKACKRNGETLQTFFLNNIDPTSELGLILKEAENRKMASLKVHETVANILATTFSSYKKDMNISNEEFAIALKQFHSEVTKK